MIEYASGDVLDLTELCELLMKRLIEATSASVTALSAQHSKWYFDMEANKNQPPSDVVLEVRFDAEGQPIYDLAIDDGTPPPAPAVQAVVKGLLRTTDRRSRA